MMNEWWLLICFLILFLLALSLILYPFRKSSRSIFWSVPVLIALVGAGYWQWGAWPEWMSYLQANEKQKRIQTMLKSIHGPEELIEKLKLTLQKDPNSARGWYLLGRLYASQNLWQQANASFKRAHELQPDDEQMTVNYAQSCWELNHQAFDSSSRQLLTGILERHANQPDALAMLAMDAYKRRAYQQAIDYWQHLLQQVPPESNEGQAIRKAIAKAQSHLSIGAQQHRRRSPQ